MDYFHHEPLSAAAGAEEAEFCDLQPRLDPGCCSAALDLQVSEALMGRKCNKKTQEAPINSHHCKIYKTKKIRHSSLWLLLDMEPKIQTFSKIQKFFLKF